MSKLLILGPSFRRNADPQLLPAIERYDGIFYKIVRKYMDKIRKKGIDILILTEDLDLIPPETLLPYNPPIGEKWTSISPHKHLKEIKCKKIQEKLIKLLKTKHYDEIFIALNRHYRKLLPDLTPYTKHILSNFKGIGPKAQALKKWINEG